MWLCGAFRSHLLGTHEKVGVDKWTPQCIITTACMKEHLRTMKRLFSKKIKNASSPMSSAPEPPIVGGTSTTTAGGAGLTLQPGFVPAPPVPYPNPCEHVASEDGIEPPIVSRSTTLLPAKTGLQPGFMVPPVPHPHPHEYIALLASEDGLLIRPHNGGTGPPLNPASYVRVSWGKAANIAELPSSGGGPSVDWKESVVVYGIVGLMSLFNGNKTSSADYMR